MKQFYDTAAMSGSGAAIAGGLSSNEIIGIAGLCLAIVFGCFASYLRWRDSKALHKALESADIKEAIRIRSK